MEDVIIGAFRHEDGSGKVIWFTSTDSRELFNEEDFVVGSTEEELKEAVSMKEGVELEFLSNGRDYYYVPEAPDKHAGYRQSISFEMNSSAFGALLEKAENGLYVSGPNLFLR